jgi:hypothetical protein
MPQRLQPVDDGPALAEARALVARFREPYQGPDDWLFTAGLSPLHPQAGHRMVRGMLKRYALYHPLNMTEVCAWARAGSDDADLALVELIAEFTERGEQLPLGLAAYNLELIHPRRPSRFRGRKKVTHVMQDMIIVTMIILVIERSGLKATRRQSTKPSACAIVARALEEAGVHRGGEKAIEKIWQRIAPAVLSNGFRWQPAQLP